MLGLEAAYEEGKTKKGRGGFLEGGDIDVLAERQEYCETWGWKQGVRMQWQLK